jgi:Cd2+/Zn2+-exporting ATPase
MLDTTALTGESVPRKTAPGDDVLSGCINQNGVLTIRVTKTFGESTVAKIINLVENASSKKAPTENFITTFSRYYTPAVVGLAALIAVAPPLFGLGPWVEWINRGLIFLVISCPCALVISIPLGYFGGIGGASRKGVLIKGSNYLEALNSLDIVVFDKTGTLTKGVFEVTDVYNAQGFTKETLLEKAANAEAFSNHPIALSIRKAWGKPIAKETLTGYEEISGYGIRVKSGASIVLAGNARLMNREGVSFTETQETGTKVYVAVDNKFAGSIVISDEVKTDSRAAIAALKERGVSKTVMLTGDNPEIAHAIATELRIDEYYAGLLPDQKVEQVEILNAQKRHKGRLAFVGDGINDAPVLARSDIGIAMGGLGSDAAIEAADVVLMTDEPSKLTAAIDIAKATKRIVWQNIIFALGVKGAFLVLGAIGISTMWEAVFADVGVAVLAILNATRIMKTK